MKHVSDDYRGIARARSARAVVVFVCLMLSGTAQAFAEQPICFERQYDAAHLAAHSQQLVQRIQLVLLPSMAGIEIELRNGGVWAADALCGQEADHIRCGLICDGGRFSLVKTTNGIRLSIVDDFLALSICTESDTTLQLAAEPDDRAFMLYPSRCRTD